QAADVQLPHARLHAIDQLLGQTAGFTVPDFCREAAAIRRAQNGPATRQERAEFLIIQGKISLRLENAFIAAEKADRLPAALRGRFRHGANDCVQPGAVAAARHDSDTFAHLLVPFGVCSLMAWVTLVSRNAFIADLSVG